MPERYIFCGGLQAPRKSRDALSLDVNATAARNRVNLQMETYPNV
jgi:hypothetical protein